MQILAVEERCRWDGNGLMAAGEHRPTVAGSLGDEEGLALAQELEHGQVVDVARVTVGKLESGRRDWLTARCRVDAVIRRQMLGHFPTVTQILASSQNGIFPTAF